MAAAVGFTQEKTFYDDAEKAHEERADEETQPEISQASRYRIGDIRPEHVERSVGHVQHAHHAEDEGEARGDKEQEHPVYQAVDRLDDISCNP